MLALEPYPSQLATPTHQARNRGRKWSALAGTIAASLLVCASIYRLNRPVDDLSNAVTEAPASPAFGGHATSSLNFSADAVTEATAEVPPALVIENSKAGMLAMTADAPASVIAKEQQFETDLLHQRLAIAERQLLPGELISYLDTINEQPVIVTYTVVDVVDAFDDVQVLLQREGIRPVGTLSDESSDQPWMVNSSERTIAIYLEAPPAQVDAVLKELPVVFHPPESVSGFASTAPAASTASRAAAEQKVDQTVPQPATVQDGKKQNVAIGDVANDAEAFQVVVPVDAELRQRFASATDGSQSYALRPLAPEMPAEVIAESAADGSAKRAIPGAANNGMEEGRNGSRVPARRSVIVILQRGDDSN